MVETLYDVLGVPEDADPDEISDAYRDRVKEYHPDLSNDPDAAEKFRWVVRAEEVLSDARERRRYDRLGHAAYCDAVGWADGAPGADAVERPDAAASERQATREASSPSADSGSNQSESTTRTRPTGGVDAHRSAEGTYGAGQGRGGSDANSASHRTRRTGPADDVGTGGVRGSSYTWRDQIEDLRYVFEGLARTWPRLTLSMVLIVLLIVGHVAWIGLFSVVAEDSNELSEETRAEIENSWVWNFEPSRVDGNVSFGSASTIHGGPGTCDRRGDRPVSITYYVDGSTRAVDRGVTAVAIAYSRALNRSDCGRYVVPSSLNVTGRDNTGTILATFRIDTPWAMAHSERRWSTRRYLRRVYSTVRYPSRTRSGTSPQRRSPSH